MKYVSCFSGIGGLEATRPPEQYCEQDPAAAAVLRARHPGIDIWPDVCTLDPPAADVVAGGWPCQDLSIAGKQQGLAGLRSGLLRQLLRVAARAGAHTIVAENVPNLLKMRTGDEFEASLAEFARHGYGNVGWRILNAREFGLPQNRSRLLIIASKNRELVYTLFRAVVPVRKVVDKAGADVAAGFYWTAGTHSINYTRGFVPAIKIGSSVGIASPPAVHYGEVVRVLSADEALKLQGFDLTTADFGSRTEAYKAAGNAVARDIGRWVLDGVVGGSSVPPPATRPYQQSLLLDGPREGYPAAGLVAEGVMRPVAVAVGRRASNLSDFLDLTSPERLSWRASGGLLRRLDKSQMPCPPDLRAALATHGRQEVA